MTVIVVNSSTHCSDIHHSVFTMREHMHACFLYFLSIYTEKGIKLLAIYRLSFILYDVAILCTLLCEYKLS